MYPQFVDQEDIVVDFNDFDTSSQILEYFIDFVNQYLAASTSIASTSIVTSVIGDGIKNVLVSLKNDRIKYEFQQIVRNFGWTGTMFYGPLDNKTIAHMTFEVNRLIDRLYSA
jgi:hypothetical protein